MTVTSTEVAWAELPRVSSAPYALLELARTPSGVVRAAVDDTGRRLLMITAPDLAGALPGPFPVLHLELSSVVVDGRLDRMLVIRCEDRTFWDEFVVLADEIVVQAVVNDAPARSAITVIERWRRLLSVTRRDRLGLPQRIGLFAELVMLKALISQRPELGTDIWTGPGRTTHDFVLPTRAVEVKAVGATSDIVHIHGLEQLQPPTGLPLDLAVCTVVEDAEGMSIRDLVIDVETLLGEGAEIHKKAQEVGWTAEDLDQRFSAVDWIFVEVGEHTPRLVPADLKSGCLRQGVSRLSYDIDLNELRTAARANDLAAFVMEVTA